MVAAGCSGRMSMHKLERALAVPPGSRIKLSDIDPANTHGIHKDEASAMLAKNLERLSVLQYLLYAEARRSLLVVLQGIDAGGKDGTIRHVMSGLNPQGVSVTAFKVPEGSEKRHDYLWRVHQAVPEWGQIGIFNRSHYEDVLVVRVHNLVPKAIWSKRYRQINDFERMLSENGVTILKFLLYISKEQQAERFRQRLEDKTRNWKFSPADLKEREYWDQYIEAYEEALRKCGTDWAPWHVIPSNKKWFRNLAVSQIMVNALERMRLKYPQAAADLSEIKFE
jgi:PPK2 family polyphosphate:nucleotide phosphotransferase